MYRIGERAHAIQNAIHHGCEKATRIAAWNYYLRKGYIINPVSNKYNFTHKISPNENFSRAVFRYTLLPGIGTA